MSGTYEPYNPEYEPESARPQKHNNPFSGISRDLKSYRDATKYLRDLVRQEWNNALYLSELQPESEELQESLIHLAGLSDDYLNEAEDAWFELQWRIHAPGITLESAANLGNMIPEYKCLLNQAINNHRRCSRLNFRLYN